MTATARTPNPHLRALLQEAGWSGERLARAVNRAGLVDGHRYTYDRTAVAHWLQGSRPAPPVPQLVAEVLSRALGRPVPVEQTGLGRDGAPPAPAEPDGPGAAALVTLARCETDPAALVYTLTYRQFVPAEEPAGISEPGTGEPPADAPGTSAAAPARIGTAHLRAAQDLLRSALAGEQSAGAAFYRRTVAGFLATAMADWLRASSPPGIRRELLCCASELSYLTGFAYFDAQRQGAAQGYYRAAASLAAQAADPRRHSLALRALSVQAHYLGHRRHARDLAEAAAAQLDRLPDRQAAFVLGQQALGAAGCRDRAAAFALLTRAHRLLEHADEPEPGIGGYHWASYAHQEAEALAALGDGEGALRALALSARERPAGEHLARAVTTVRAAQLHLAHGHLERACAVLSRLLDQQPLVASERLAGTLATVCAALRRHTGSTGVRALLARLDPPATAGPAHPGRTAVPAPAWR
ncbi:hypothetical protein OG500_35910 [Kitasatospora sp. NBC_01250]|uniref:hypothetical protein n=1 Tax=Kitasatospora sp. NBC_01250 TaxID=2903571 RepID=UPI002E330183|nr:hypothetical protein [Kitasatospora sp. NBC_01250]